MDHFGEHCFHMDVRSIRIIKASSPDREGLLHLRIKELEAAGLRVLFDDLSPNATWSWTAGSVADRSKALNNALLEESSDAVMWARGGYGASDLLDLVPWELVKKAKNKPIIGFSDVCAAQSALYTKTGRPSIHGPMPATITWKKSGTTDVDQLLNFLQGRTRRGEISVTPVLDSPREAAGTLFGGCLSVLTSLIGTEYLPRNLAGYILFFEDIGENPGRIIRMLNQWQQAGLFSGVQGLVLGSFSDLGGGLADSSPILAEEVFHRYKLPTFTSPDFGHISPNFPLVMGASGKIHLDVTHDKPRSQTEGSSRPYLLTWDLKADHRQSS
jgi:muramoyltetrapeptide carboxypeptidase